MATPLSPQDFAAKIRTAHPGAYDDLSDADLTQKVIAKYPQYSDMVQQSAPVPTAPAVQPGTMSRFGSELVKKSGEKLSGDVNSWLTGGAMGNADNGDVRQSPVATGQTFNPFHPIDTAGYLVPQPVKNIWSGLTGGKAPEALADATVEGVTQLPAALQGVGKAGIPSEGPIIRGAAKTVNTALDYAPGAGTAVGGFAGLKAGGALGHPIVGAEVGATVGNRVGAAISDKIPRVPTDYGFESVPETTNPVPAAQYLEATKAGLDDQTARAVSDKVYQEAKATAGNASPAAAKAAYQSPDEGQSYQGASLFSSQPKAEAQAQALASRIESFKPTDFKLAGKQAGKPPSLFDDVQDDARVKDEMESMYGTDLVTPDKPRNYADNFQGQMSAAMEQKVPSSRYGRAAQTEETKDYIAGMGGYKTKGELPEKYGNATTQPLSSKIQPKQSVTDQLRQSLAVTPSKEPFVVGAYDNQLVNVTGMQGDRNVINPILSKYLPKAQADRLVGRSQWTAGELHDAINSLSNARPSNAKTAAISLLQDKLKAIR